MGIFDFFKRSYREQVVLEYMIQKNCNVAIGFAERFEKDFDYSKRSLSDLEEILEYYSKDLLKSNPSENQLISTSLIFGSNLGQTLLMQGLSQKGYRWAKNESSPLPFLRDDEGNAVTPVDKVFKRITGGKSESILSFYTAVTTSLL